MARDTNAQGGAAPTPTPAQLKQAKQKAERDAAQEARIQKVIENANAKIGGRVNEGATPEENGRLLNAFVAEVYREDPERDWPMLTKGNKFIEEMRKQPFKLLYTDEDEDEEVESTRRQRRAPRKAVEPPKPRKRTREPEQPKEDVQSATFTVDEAAKVIQTLAQAPQPNGKKEEKTAAAPISTSTTADAPPSHDVPPPKKKRRTDNLESNLGKKWDARVDEFGRRATRGARQKQ
ncbi:hypothetical protein F4821DRAFT_232570 [Hypoxylon rubiginosum]|uniref:Uncharacterized protein n=1 Tax=Hypoxylon rubiginosum TaxID=110542 RepID=A0ACC0D8G0_9PEZI|nr:hypothetical protein F4821DRAFT_232570 [Hypoxylon rubiginosum]